MNKAPTVIIVGKNKKNIIATVRKVGFRIVTKSPDFVISFGGDGTLMHSEHLYPGIPKILLKDSLICKKCSSFPNETVLKKVIRGAYTIEELSKIEASVGSQTIYAVNDIIVHNKNPRHAIRYSLRVADREVAAHIIGDGIVVATPFGSTAYYRSITDSFFEVGIGLAFNNSTEPSDHMVLREDTLISMSIIRGPAIVYADNQESAVDVGDHGRITIRQSSEKARLVIPS